MGQNLMVRLLHFSKIQKFQLIKKCGRLWLNENQIQEQGSTNQSRPGEPGPGEPGPGPEPSGPSTG